MNKIRLSTLFAAFSAVFILCSVNPVDPNAGGGTGDEVECMAITGKVVHPDNSPAAGATVRLRSKNFRRVPEGIDDPYTGTNGTFDTVTSDDGSFRITHRDSGVFFIEVAASPDSSVLVRCTLSTGDTLLALPTDTLHRTGEVRGRVNILNSSFQTDAYIMIYGLDRLFATSTGKDFRFPGLPEGLYRIRIVPRIDSRLAVEYDSVQVIRGTTTFLGTLNLPPLEFFVGCPDGDCDRRVVRGILDSVGLDTVQVSEVAVFDSVSRRMTELNMGGYGLNWLSGEIGKPTCLRRLILNSNRLRTIPPEIGYLSHLKVLDISNNELKELPLEFGNLDSLALLSAGHNSFDHFPEEIQTLSSLKTLSFRHSPLGDPKTVSFPRSLQVLDLANTGMSTLPKSVCSAVALSFLDCGNNSLKTLPTDIGALTNLEHLILTQNQLVTIPSELGGCRRLRILDLGENMLHTLPDSLSNTANLTTIFLNHNLFSSVPPVLRKMDSLQHVSFQQNQLCNVSAEEIRWLDKMNSGWETQQECR